MKLEEAIKQLEQCSYNLKEAKDNVIDYPNSIKAKDELDNVIKLCNTWSRVVNVMLSASVINLRNLSR